MRLHVQRLRTGDEGSTQPQAELIWQPSGLFQDALVDVDGFGSVRPWEEGFKKFRDTTGVWIVQELAGDC